MRVLYCVTSLPVAVLYVKWYQRSTAAWQHGMAEQALTGGEVGWERGRSEGVRGGGRREGGRGGAEQQPTQPPTYHRLTHSS